MNSMKILTVAILSWCIAGTGLSLAQEQVLFNGKDLTGWEGNPELWSVQNGCITGVTKDDAPLPYNQFLIWRAGTVKNFELRVVARQAGNNSGFQYRSKEQPTKGPWSIVGYQCDMHPTAENNAMLYDEGGRGIVCKNGQSVIVDSKGDKWLVRNEAPVKVEVADWNEYKIIAKGNHLIHQVNGKTTADIIDHQVSERELEGLLAFQVHRGPAMKVEIKEVVLKVLPDGDVLSEEQHPIPADAKKIEPPAKAKAAPAKDKPAPAKAKAKEAAAKVEPTRASTASTSATADQKKKRIGAIRK